MSDRTFRIEASIRDLATYLNPPMDPDQYSDLLFTFAIDYAGDNPGDYFLTLPEGVLPISS